MRCEEGVVKKDRSTGLTLIEVLLAVSIMSLGLTIMLTAIARCLGVFRAAKDYHVAQGVRTQGEFENPIFEKKADPDVEPSDFEVSEETYEDAYTFSREVEDPSRDDENEDGRLLVLRTKVSWASRGRENTDEVAQYLYYREKD